MAISRNKFAFSEKYFDAVVPNPAIDELNITLVDGFCGGGAYDSSGEIEHGSPLILLKAVRDAERRLNAVREKPLERGAKKWLPVFRNFAERKQICRAWK